MRVCFVCSDVLILAGLCSFLEATENIALVRSDGSVEAARGHIGLIDAIVLCADRLSPKEFADLSRLRSQSKIPVVSVSGLEKSIFSAHSSIADLNVPSHLGSNGLQRALQSISCNSISKSVTSHNSRQAKLTKREREVCGLIGCGYSNRQIAENLGLREQSVKNLASMIMRKLGCENRVQVALRFAERAKIAG